MVREHDAQFTVQIDEKKTSVCSQTLVHPRAVAVVIPAQNQGCSHQMPTKVHYIVV